MFHEHVSALVAAGAQLPPKVFIGSGGAYMAGRLAHVFGLCGPCVSTDTACSSSLVAIHLACTALANCEADAAVAAGANIMLLAATTAAICQLQACALWSVKCYLW